MCVYLCVTMKSVNLYSNLLTSTRLFFNVASYLIDISYPRLYKPLLGTNCREFKPHSGQTLRFSRYFDLRTLPGNKVFLWEKEYSGLLTKIFTHKNYPGNFLVRTAFSFLFCIRNLHLNRIRIRGVFFHLLLVNHCKFTCCLLLFVKSLVTCYKIYLVLIATSLITCWSL